MSGERKILRCDDVAPLLVFYTCDEVSAEEREQIVAHLANCSACSAQLVQEDALRDAIGHIPQAADQFDTANVLLSQCRSELSESLDQLSAPKVDEGWQPFSWARQWMALRPGWSAAALMLVGAIVGTQALHPRIPTRAPTGSPLPRERRDSDRAAASPAKYPAPPAKQPCRAVRQAPST